MLHLFAFLAFRLVFFRLANSIPTRSFHPFHWTRHDPTRAQADACKLFPHGHPPQAARTFSESARSAANQADAALTARSGAVGAPSTVTARPCASRRSTILRPRKPVPPVTTTGPSPKSQLSSTKILKA